MEFSYVAGEIQGGDRITYVIVTDQGQLIMSDVSYQDRNGNGQVNSRDFRGVDPEAVKGYIRTYLNKKKNELIKDENNTSGDVTFRAYRAHVPSIDGIKLTYFQASRRHAGRITAARMTEITQKLRGGPMVGLDKIKDYENSYGDYKKTLKIFEEYFDRLADEARFDGPDDNFLGSNNHGKLPDSVVNAKPSKKGKKVEDEPEAPTEERFVIESGEKFVRPNGEEYRPRDFQGHTDVAFLRKMRDCGIAMRISGPPGSGKTALVEAAFPGCVTVSGHGDMDVSSFVGTDRQVKERIIGEDGRVTAVVTSWEWQDGPLVTAMKEGKVFFIDEATRVPTEVMNILFSVMDGRGMLRIDQKADNDDAVVHAAPGFYAVMGYNPATLGARALDEALISRFRMLMHVETDFDTARALKVPAEAVKVALKMDTRNRESLRDGGVGYWVPQMRELLTYRDLIDAGVGKQIAMMNLLASCPDEDSVEALTEAIQKVDKDMTDLGVPSLGGCV